ncbi:hypothetical protein M9435_004353 [Picochlorum sp. BPE23]|nr:hypothetical protein M9435_004353 [Picochlorum sp. BPE23]
MGKRMLQRGPARQRDRKRRREFTQLALGLATKDTPDGAGGHPIVSTPVLPPKEDTFDTPLIYTGPANYEQYVCQGKGSDSGCLGAETHKMILETPMTGEKALRPSPDTTILYSGGQSRSYTSLRPRKLEFEEENTMDSSSKQMMMDANSTRNKVNVIDCVFGEGLRDHVLGSFEYLDLINQQHWSVQSNPFEAKESPATMHYCCSPIIIQEEAEKSVDVVQIVSQATQTERRIDLWTYDERLLPGEGYKCKLSIVKSLNDMKMYSLLLVKFQYPGLTEKECMKLVEYGYCVLLNSWLENYEEQDSIVLAQANEIQGFASSSVRKRMNSILGQASSWPISFKNNLSFKTFETPRKGRAYESQETLDCLKAAIIKNAKEQHAKHMAKAPTGCESLLDAVRPDKVAEVVIQYINKKNEAPSPAQT